MLRKATLSTLLVVSLFCFSPAQNGKIDSLEKELKRVQSLKPSRANDSVEAIISVNLAGMLKAKDPERGISFALNAIEKFKKIERPRGIGNSIVILGTCHKNKGDYPKAVNFARMALRIGLALKDTIMICNAYNNIGNTYLETGNYSEALKNHLLSMKIREIKRDSLNLDDTYTNIGHIYARQNDYKTACVYYRKSLKVRERQKDSLGIADLYSNLAYAQDLTSNFDSAMTLHYKALGIFTRFGDAFGLINEYNNLGGHYFFLKNYDSTLRYQKISLEAYEQMNDPVGLSGAYNNLSSFYFENGKYADAKNNALKAKEIAEKTGNLEWLKVAYELLYKINQKTKKYEEAFDYHLKYSKIKDSILNENNSREMGRLEAKSDYEKQQAIADEKHRLEMEKQKELAALEHKQKNTILFFIMLGLAMLLVFFIILFRRYKHSQRQKAVIETQKMEVESQKEIIELKQKEIIDSINYAERLQKAILVTESQIKESLPESFLFYQPKDIVAGDFYFFEKTSTHLFYAAADCTGHGVPGALVSVVCSNALSRSVNEFRLTEPGAILDKSRELVLDTFSKSGKDVKDGMDISLFVKNLQNGKCMWAGANNPLWYLHAGHIEEIGGDKQPIGHTEKPRPFTTQHLDVQPGDFVFLFTDGMADQFGGPKGKKFKYRQLQDLLLKAGSEKAESMEKVLRASFKEWMGDLEQVDDVCVIGFRL